MRSWTDGHLAGRGETDRGRGGPRPLRRLRRLRALAWLGLICVAGCGGARAGAERSSVPSGGKVVTAEEIAASGAKTAWDALRKTVPNVQLRERDGQPSRVTRRGRASIYLDDQVRIILDNSPIYDLRVLDEIAASSLLSIEVLSGLDATTQYGGRSTSGVIVIRTKNGSD